MGAENIFEQPATDLSLPQSREEMETVEAGHLAPWAQKAADSRGRRFDEPHHPFRTVFQRDRARIIHSRAFRRLEGKTQVFLSGTSDHLRTRLTHTMEVASISRSLARALRCNEDLAEAIALAHDLGHSPFGHSGERVLKEEMQQHGGFEHNLQSLRIVEFLERKYPGWPGLNLSFEVIEGLQKHENAFPDPDHPGATYPSPSLEAQIADISDEIAYYSHDLDDGLNFHLLTVDQLQQLEIWQVVEARVRKRFPEISADLLNSYIIRCIIDYEVEDVINTTAGNIRALNPQSVHDIRRHPQSLACYSEETRRMNIELRKFLYNNMYFHPRVREINTRGCQLLREYFRYLLEHPETIRHYRRRYLDQDDPMHRQIADYVSGMSDNFLISEHYRLVGANG